MATLKISFLFSITLHLLFHSTGSTNSVCEKRYCGGPETEEIPFEFPFLLRGTNNFTDNESFRCGYPGFDVLCNKSRKQALITLSTAGEFVVKYTSIEKQRIWINDPKECLPRRFLQNIDLQDSPFQIDYSYYYSTKENITFFNCTQIAGEPKPMFADLPVIPCLNLNNNEYSINYALQPFNNLRIPASCREIGFVLVPVRDGSRQSHVINDGLYSDIVLRWDTPQCNCQADQYCGFLTDTGSAVTCYNKYNFDPPGGNLSKPRHKNIYFFPIVWGISGLLFFFWVILSVCKDRQQHQSQQRQTNIEAINREPPWYVLGLDRSRIEQYPKIQLAESGQLPKSIDNVCSICLSEYKPMETLRSMPQCNHYFHVDCIDVWLKMNATCPLCRNLPEGSTLVIPSLPPPTSLHQPPSS